MLLNIFTNWLALAYKSKTGFVKSSFSIHLVFALLDGVRNNFESLYPQWLLLLFPFLHYPLYRCRLMFSVFCLMLPDQDLPVLLHLPGDQCGHREALRRVQPPGLQVSGAA